ncbi:L,D-transpeptidase [Propylenella binzhouense]|uniref:L,D-transpeptidase n=1 Tax=Propylenella binzhouense TaxID=2555902 RepID=A0A964WS58_9HYPH|nr:L,D-transpeptidase [Propylenella binzhouense]MYZ46505.1 L,D-transpeptidase [Propylenella binzhouense]
MQTKRAARALCLGAAFSVLLPVVADAQVTRFYDPSTRSFLTYDPAPRRSWSVPAEFRRQIVPFPTEEAPGTIIIDSASKHLYFVLAGGEAIRYGIGVGREGFGWHGVVRVGAKAEWPTWTPPSEMIAREPTLAQYSGGMPGGPDNPLGARALYLFDGGRDTMYRIHGTNEPWTIGHNVSSGCIRMMNHDVMELHYLAKVGAKVIVR